VGSRNKLSEAFLKALEADFQAHGAIAIEDVRTKRPQDCPSQELKVALAEFAADYQAVKGACKDRRFARAP
jgi:hypothetical protein